MLDPRDLTAAATRFGVAEEQVRRDHLIAHILAAVAEVQPPGVVFLGGTALSWTHLPDGRLSEDIDLMSDDRAATAGLVEERIPRLLRREFPGTAWDPGLRAIRSTATARLTTPDDLVVRIQLLDTKRQGWQDIPTTSQCLVNRYRDVPATTLSTPTLAGFAAMKSLAWTDRRAPRDLYDLAGLARLDALGEEAAALFARSTGRRLAIHDFDRAPSSWDASLRHQTGRLPSALECLHTVRRAYAASLGWS